MFFNLVDSYSKRLGVVLISTATSATTIDCLRSISVTHCIPEVLYPTMVRNSPVKSSAPSWSVMASITSYHPVTNGLAERAVKSFKRSMKKDTQGTIASWVVRFLFIYRCTSHMMTRTPVELLLGRIPRSHLDLFKPAISVRVKNKQQL